MAHAEKGGPVTVTIELEPALVLDVERAAARRDLSIPEYVVDVLRQATEREPGDRSDWARLSSASFARDWGSDEDRVYDELS
jgi:hypothetical protein